MRLNGGADTLAYAIPQGPHREGSDERSDAVERNPMAEQQRECDGSTCSTPLAFPSSSAVLETAWPWPIAGMAQRACECPVQSPQRLRFVPGTSRHLVAILPQSAHNRTRPGPTAENADRAVLVELT